MKKELKAARQKLSKYEANTSLAIHRDKVPERILVESNEPRTPNTPLPETPNSPNELNQLTMDQDIDESAEPERPRPRKKVEKDPFWLDVNEKMSEVKYDFIKKCIPHRDFIGEEDERWKMMLWKMPYGDFELRCTVALESLNTGAWTDEDVELLYASVSKFGVNSMASWDKIAEAVNREVDDVMEQYGELLSIPVKKLKKMSHAR